MLECDGWLPEDSEIVRECSRAEYWDHIVLSLYHPHYNLSYLLMYHIRGVFMKHNLQKEVNEVLLKYTFCSYDIGRI